MLKFGSVIPCTYFDLKLNCLQCIAKTKEFTLFQYVWMKLYIQIALPLKLNCNIIQGQCLP